MDKESKSLDPFVLTLNHGETFGVFDRYGDILSSVNTTQGIFFEGARHISHIDFEINGERPLLLSSTIREDNDSLTVDLANKKFELNGREVGEGTIHIKKEINIRNNAYHEEICFKNFNPFAVAFEATIEFDADFSDVFELRGFSCEQCKPDTKNNVENRTIIFSYLGRDKVKRYTEVNSSEKKCSMQDRVIHLKLNLEPYESSKTSFDANFTRDIPEKLTYLYEGGINRKTINMGELKNLVPFIHTDNGHFNHWVRRSALDLVALFSCYGSDLYPMAGVPWYNTPFGRDGMVTAFQTLFAAPFMAKNVLKYLAKNQAMEDDPMSDAEPGKIMHELRRGELSNIGALPFRKYYGATDSTFLFIWLAQLYQSRTGDNDTINQIWENIEAALDWCENFADLDDDGFYEYQKRNPRGLDNQCWKDSHDSISHKYGELAESPIAVCEIQGYAYRAFKAAAKLYARRGNDQKAGYWRDKAKELKSRFNKVFWMEDSNFLALALDKNKKLCKVRSSNAAHCLSTGIVDISKAKKLANECLKKDMFTGWGIRTLSSEEERYNPMSYHNGSIWPHDNAMIAFGLKKYGFVEHFHVLAKAMFSTASRMDLLRLPELFCGFQRVSHERPTLYPVSCSPQAWASGSVFLLIQSMLGLKVDHLHKKVSFERPALPQFLNHLSVVDLSVDGGKITFEINRINDLEATVVIKERPEGWRVSVNK